MRAIQWASDAAAHRSHRVQKALKSGRHSGGDAEAVVDADFKSGLLKAGAAMSQVEKRMVQLRHLEEKQIMKVRTCIFVQPRMLGRFSRRLKDSKYATMVVQCDMKVRTCICAQRGLSGAKFRKTAKVLVLYVACK